MAIPGHEIVLQGLKTAKTESPVLQLFNDLGTQYNIIQTDSSMLCVDSV